ncbi:DUF3307 domain-containing protein [Natrinema thermotolerans]|uniref:DUF3307 domain-containing protein n=1 Tax=Natrinema thermotolerans TaxID=121872 RepID=UPI000679D6E4|nr:DUF3307 domain-containing protein [Natrinema thermotolerans]QCC57384.1 DUF3307 domain-containing protein [Natrinema thermotolerans]
MTDDRHALAFLAAHAAGDFPLQTDWMATEKFDSRLARAVHVTVYTAAFLPAVRRAGWPRRRAAAFLALLWTSHFVVDSQRWYENRDGFPTRALWFDQALHLIALAVALEIVDHD